MCIYNEIQKQCEFLVSQFPGIKIRIAKRYGKRVSNLFSYGVETFNPVEEINLDDNYVMFLQNFKGDSYEKNVIKDNMNRIIFSFNQ